MDTGCHRSYEAGIDIVSVIRFFSLARMPASWAVYDQILVSGANFLSTMLIAKMLSVDDFAMYSLASLAVLFFSSFQRTLITQPMNVLGATESLSQLSDRYISLLRLQRILIPLAIFFMVLLGTAFFPHVWIVFAACAYLAAFFLQELVRRFYYTRNKIDLALHNDLIGYGGQLALLTLIWVCEMHNAALAFFALAFSAIIAFLWGNNAIFRDKLRAAHAPKPVTNVLQEHWRMARWVVLSQFVFWGASQVYPFMLASWGSFRSVADFNIAVSILNALNIVRLMLGNYLPSRVTRVYAKDGTIGLRRYLLKLIFLCGGISVFIILTLIISADWLISLLFGDKYPLAGQIIGWLAIGQFAAIIGVITNAAALALRSTQWIFYANTVGTVFSLFAGKYLIVTYGVWGAVAGAGIGASLPALIQGIQVLYQCRNDNHVK